MPEAVEVKLTSVKKLQTSTRYDEDDKELVTTVKAEVRAHPVVLARILNLQKQGAPLYLVIGSHQAVMDLEFKQMEKAKPKTKAKVEASKGAPVEPDAPPPVAEESAVAETKVEEPVAVA